MAIDEITKLKEEVKSTIIVHNLDKEIQTIVEYRAIAQVLIDNNETKKNIEARFKEPKEAAFKAHKEICKLEKDFLDALQKESKKAQALLNDYDAKQEAKKKQQEANALAKANNIMATLKVKYEEGLKWDDLVQWAGMEINNLAFESEHERYSFMIQYKDKLNGLASWYGEEEAKKAKKALEEEALQASSNGNEATAEAILEKSESIKPITPFTPPELEIEVEKPIEESTSIKGLRKVRSLEVKILDESQIPFEIDMGSYKVRPWKLDEGKLKEIGKTSDGNAKIPGVSFQWFTDNNPNGK